MGASWGGLAVLEAQKWHWLEREHDFGRSQVGSWEEKWPWLEREQDFQGAAGVHRFKEGASRVSWDPPLPKLLDKADSD